MEDRRIRGVSEHGVRIVYGIPFGWVVALKAAGIELRMADLAAPALCKVAVLTMVEARRVNGAFLEKARAELAAFDAEKGVDKNLRHMYASAVEIGESVSGLLDEIEKDFVYYPSWVVLESMNID